MGQVHTCADNAAMESFNSQLQKCVFNQKKVWNTKQELRLKTFRWVTVRYDQEKRQKNLLDMTPLEYDIIVGGQQLNIE
jgi:transposase InsO family protein